MSLTTKRIVIMVWGITVATGGLYFAATPSDITQTLVEIIVVCGELILGIFAVKAN